MFLFFFGLSRFTLTLFYSHETCTIQGNVTVANQINLTQPVLSGLEHSMYHPYLGSSRGRQDLLALRTLR
jgi:hypothetical protein